MVIRNAASIEKDFDSGKTSWNDWIGEATERTRGETFVTQPNNGFSKWYEKSRATNLVKLSAAETSSDEIVSEVFEQQKWSPTISTVNTTRHMQKRNKSTDKILLPTSKSPEGNDNVIRECSSLCILHVLFVELQKLAELGNQYSDFVSFLKSIGLSEVAENVES